ncbi:MAG: hypothetical protein KVP17_002660, partial [Porospora cf. gigantea B]
MMQWTKAAIRRVIWSRKQERWLERMRQLGVPVHTCDICSRQVTAQHQCVPTGLAVPGAKDTPYSRKEIVVAQQGRNLALKPKVVVDTGKLKDELHKMTAILADKDALAAQQEQFTEALIGLTNALVADRNSETASHERREEPATTTGAERKEIPFTSGRTDPPTTACQYESRRISRRRRSSTSFPLQFLPIHQDTKLYHGLVDTGSQINVVDAELAASLRQDKHRAWDVGATEVRGITGNNTAILGW